MDDNNVNRDDSNWRFTGIMALARNGRDSGMDEHEIMQLLLDTMPTCTTTSIKSAVAIVMDQQRVTEHGAF